MEDCVQLDIPAESVEEWFQKACHECDLAIDICSKVLGEERDPWTIPVKTLTALLKHPQTCRFFGTPAGKPVAISPSEDISSFAMQQQWGRRMHHHADALRIGYQVRSEVEALEETNASSRTTEHLTSLESLLERFAKDFPRRTAPIDEVKEILWPQSNPRLLARFFSTSLDPYLHSSLIYLDAAGRDGQGNEELERVLVMLLEHEFGRLIKLYTEFHSGSKPVSDESTLWWAHSAILKRRREKYSIGEYKGYAGAEEVVNRLIGKPDRDLIYPTPLEASREGAPDIYDKRRTRLYLLLNCVRVASLMPANSVSEEFADRLTRFALDQFQRVVDELENPTADSNFSLFFLGTSLQVASETLRYVIQRDAGKTSTAKYFGKGKGQVQYENQEDKHFTLAESHAAILEALFAAGQPLSTKEITELTDNQHPPSTIRTMLDTHAYLRPHLLTPGRRGRIGYRLQAFEDARPKQPTDDANSKK